MYLTHTFSHHETLSRARSWLTQLGFEPREFGSQGSGVSRLVIVDEPQRLAAAKMLINAVENNDPDGFASFWDQASKAHHVPKGHYEGIPAERHEPHSSVIGWHPLD